MLRLTDTNGNFQFPAMQRKTINQSQVILLVFSITNRQSFEFLSRVHEDIRRHSKQKLIILVGNKCDEFSARQISQSHALQHANSWNCPYVETSAKDDTNINELFSGAARLCIESVENSCDSTSKQRMTNGYNHNTVASSTRRAEREKIEEHCGRDRTSCFTWCSIS